MGTFEGLPHPILSSWPWRASFLTEASAWKAAAVEPSRKEMKTQDFSGRSRTDSMGPKRTRLRSSSTEASAGELVSVHGHKARVGEEANQREDFRRRPFDQSDCWRRRLQ